MRFAFRSVRAPGYQRDATIDGAIDRVGEEVAIEAGDRDAIDTLSDERSQNLLLANLIGRFWTAPHDLDASQFPRRSLGSDASIVENRNVQRLRNDGEAQPARLLRRWAGAGTRRNEDGEESGHADGR